MIEDIKKELKVKKYLNTLSDTDFQLAFDFGVTTFCFGQGIQPSGIEHNALFKGWIKPFVYAWLTKHYFQEFLKEKKLDDVFELCRIASKDVDKLTKMVYSTTPAPPATNSVAETSSTTDAQGQQMNFPMC